MTFVVASPAKYQFDAATIETLMVESPQLQLQQTTDPVEAVTDATVVYTDVWASMGQEGERQQRLSDFADYQVNQALMAHASDETMFMHCLPARRGEEVTDEVIDGPRSIVVPQAANRMHAQKGILTWLLGANA